MTDHSVRVELEGLITLLAQHLYAEPDVFLRELIQNAHDSILRHRGRGRIHVLPDRTHRTLVVQDDGAGLSADEVHGYLATIGRSGTRELARELAGRDSARAEALIGRFGIGLLSAFIVANRVDVITRSAGHPALRWTSRGSTTYKVEPATRPSVGTEVVLHLRPEHSRYLDPDRLRDIVRRYADLLGIAVHVGGDDEPANAVHGPWHVAPEQEGEEERRQRHRTFWEHRFPREVTLDILPLDTTFAWTDPTSGDRREGRLLGVLGVSARSLPALEARGTIDLYIARMFIRSGSRRMLPDWARFVRGVVECAALTPNAARDDVVEDAALSAARSRLGELVLLRLRNLAGSDPPRLAEILRWHSPHVLATCTIPGHEALFEALADLLPLPGDGGARPLPAWIDDAKPGPDGRRVLHYVAGQGAAGRFFVLCRARGLRALDASEPATLRFLERYVARRPDELGLRRIDDTNSVLLFEPLPEEERARFQPLERAVSELFAAEGCSALACRYLPSDVPAVVTEPREQAARRELRSLAWDPSLPQALRDAMSGYLDEARDPLLLRLNATNPVVRRLASREPILDDTGRLALKAIHDSALLTAGRMLTPDSIEGMLRDWNRLVELLLLTPDVGPGDRESS